MNKKILILLSVITLFGIYHFSRRGKDERLSNVSPLQKSEISSLKKQSKLSKVISEKVTSRKRTLGSYSGKNKNKRTTDIWYSEYDQIDSQVWSNNGVIQLKGLYSTHKTLIDREIIKTINGRNVYEAEGSEIENVFIDKASQKVLFWSGELIIEAERDLSIQLEELSGVEVIKFVGPYIIIKVNSDLEYLKDLEFITTGLNIKGLELDLSSQRRKKI